MHSYPVVFQFTTYALASRLWGGGEPLLLIPALGHDRRMNRSQRRAAHRHQAKRSNGRAGPPAHLPRRVMAAFDRLTANGGLGELPQWGRSVRIGADYALRVAMPNDSSGEEACDDFAWTCTVLGNLAKQDIERGDPVASCEAQQRAEKAGPLHAQAFSLLDTIRDCTDVWIAQGRTYPALPAAQMQVLQAAARGERVRAAELEPVREKAEELAGILSRPILKGD